MDRELRTWVPRGYPLIGYVFYTAVTTALRPQNSRSTTCAYSALLPADNSITRSYQSLR